MTERALWVAKTGLDAQQTRMAVISNNLANVNTTGYKAEEHRLRAVQVRSQGLFANAALPTRAMAVDASTHADLRPGPTTVTGAPLDIAIKGQGWIALAMPDGSEAYTRAGNLQVNVNGILQTPAGIPVQGDGGVITIPPDSRVVIGADGTISILPETGAQNTGSTVGRIKLVNPPPADLSRGEDGLFRLPEGQAAPNDDAVRISVGHLEGSNVNPAEQMVAMIALSRQFEMQIKMLQSADANDRAASQILAAR